MPDRASPSRLSVRPGRTTTIRPSRALSRGWITIVGIGSTGALANKLQPQSGAEPSTASRTSADLIELTLAPRPRTVCAMHWDPKRISAFAGMLALLAPVIVAHAGGS